MKRNLIIPAFICISFILSCMACNRAEQNSGETAEVEMLPEDIVEMRSDQIEMAGIEFGSIEFRSLKSNLKVSGIVTVAPKNYATVSIPMGGFIESSSLIPGDAVRMGQTLAILESQDFLDLQENYLEARNKLEFAEAEFNRHSELYKQDVYSEKNLQLVTSDYKSLKAQARALEQKLQMVGVNPADLREDNISRSLIVTAPISGYIKAVGVNIGKFVNSADILFEIVNIDNLMLELTLFEKDADKVSEGQHIRFFINNETESHDAEVIQTGKAINDDKTYKVYARVLEKCENLLPGMYVNATVEKEGPEVTAIPSEAVVTFEDRDYIFIYEKEKTENGQPFTEYRMIEVEIGLKDDGFLEVKLPSELDPHELKVVVKGAYNLLSAKKNAGEMAC